MPSSSSKTIPLPHKNGTAYRVSLPDGSFRYTLLQEVDDIVSILENTYEGGSFSQEISHIDSLINFVQKQDEESEESGSGGYTADPDSGGGGGGGQTTAVVPPPSGRKRYISSSTNARRYERFNPKPQLHTGPTGAQYFLDSEVPTQEEGAEEEGETEVITEEGLSDLRDKWVELQDELEDLNDQLKEMNESEDGDEYQAIARKQKSVFRKAKKAKEEYRKAKKEHEQSTEAAEEARPPLEPTIENLKKLLTEDSNHRDVFTMLDQFSEQERLLYSGLIDGPVESITDETWNEYIGSKEVQEAIQAVNLITGIPSGEGQAGNQGTGWRNLERLKEIPMVELLSQKGENQEEKQSRRFREGSPVLNEHCPRLTERLDALDILEPDVLAYFEKHNKLPPIDKIDDETGKPKFEKIPLSHAEWEDVREAKWTDEQRKFELSITGSSSTISVDNLLTQLAKLQGVMHTNLGQEEGMSWKRRGEGRAAYGRVGRGTVPLNLETPDGKQTIQISHDTAYELTEYLIRNMPKTPGTLSGNFVKRFRELNDRGLDDPSIGTNHLVKELYDSTNFGEFHTNLSTDLEKSSNSLLSGLVKDSISRQIGGEVIHHGSGGTKRDRFKIRETTHTDTVTDAETGKTRKVGRTGQQVGTFVSIERGYDLYNMDLVDSYVTTHRSLNQQLLGITYPNTKSLTLYRGTNRAEIASPESSTSEEASIITPRRRRGFFRRLRDVHSAIQGAGFGAGEAARTAWQGGPDPRQVSTGVVSNSLSAWSINPEIAYNFSSRPESTRGRYDVSSGPYEGGAPYEGGICLTTTVGFENIFTSYGNGHGGNIRNGNEGEMWLINKGGQDATALGPDDFRDSLTSEGVWDEEKDARFIDDPERPEEEPESVRQIYAKSLTMKVFREMFQKQKKTPRFHIIVDDAINSDWIVTSFDKTVPHPELGARSNMTPLEVEFPVEDETSDDDFGYRSGMLRVPVEQGFVPHTTPTVQKQRELGQTLASAKPATPAGPSKEDTVHPSAKGKVRTVIYELVHRAGRTFERRRTAWVRPKVAEALESRQKASDWIRLLGNYLPLYFVGGYVRDKLMGKASTDIDIISLADMETVKREFDKLNIKYWQGKTLKQQQVLTFKVGDMDVDLTVAEAEDLPKDLMRRDFTVNSVAQSVTGQFYDPSNGLADIKARILRSSRNQSSKKFEEDPIRIFRAARFSAHYKLRVHPSVIKGIREHKEKLADAPASRIGKEFTQIMQIETSNKAMEFLLEHELLGYIDESLVDMVGFKQNTPHHKWDVWRHTMTALRSAESDDLILNMAILFHDIGKPDAADEDQSTFHGHEKQSAEHAARIMKKLNFPSEQVKRVENLVGMHMRLLTIPPDASTGAFRRIKAQAGQDLERLIALAKADIRGSSIEVEDKLNALDNIVETLNNVKDIPKKESLSPISGEEIMEEIDVSEGPDVGQIKEHLHNLVVDEELDGQDKEQAIVEGKKFFNTISKELDEMMELVSNV